LGLKEIQGLEEFKDFGNLFELRFEPVTINFIFKLESLERNSHGLLVWQFKIDKGNTKVT
jgi:hypothetical protein